MIFLIFIIRAVDIDEGRRGAIIGVGVILLLFAVVRLLFEIIQFGLQTSLFKFYKNYKGGLVDCGQLFSYILDFVNWLEIALYVCTIVFVGGVYLMSVRLCAVSGVWSVGVAAVFLGWTVLIIFMSKFPKVGIYVIILVQISKTYLTMILLTALMIVTFGLTFYLTFFDTRVEVNTHTHTHSHSQTHTHIHMHRGLRLVSLVSRC